MTSQSPDPARKSGSARRSAKSARSDLPIVGWREWLALPGLGIPKIKAKIDTGARSSSLHAFGIERGRGSARDRVAFYTSPHQRGEGADVSCSAELLDLRTVRSSNGVTEERYFIRVMARLHGLEWPIHLTLAERSHMSFRMLLGREAIEGRFLVDAGRSYVDRALVGDRDGPSEEHE